MPQITSYISDAERVELVSYAAEFGLDGSSIGNLLLVRELRVGMLLSRRLSRRSDDMRSDMSGKRVKITAHQSDDKILRAFKEHAATCGLSLSTAFGLIVRNELKKKWLGSATRMIDST